MIVDRILRAAAAKAANRRPPSIGAWNCGRCVRQLWYTAHGVPGEPMQPRSMLVFDLGDRIEDAVLHWLTESKTVHIRANESRDFVFVKEIGGRVRADFFFECDLFPLVDIDEPGTVVYVPGENERPPQPGELLVGEIKSMSDYGFMQAQRGIIDDAYLCQIEVYMRAYSLRHALVVAYRKETSHLCEVLIARSNERWQWLQRNVARAREATLPDRPYELETACKGCNGTGETAVRKQAHKACEGSGIEAGGPFLPNFPCGYCQWKEPCFGSVELTVSRDGKPRWRPMPPGIKETAA